MRGRNSHHANISESPLSIIRFLEKLDDRLARNERELAGPEKPACDLEFRIGLRFEHETRLKSLHERQQRLESALRSRSDEAFSQTHLARHPFN